MCVCFFLFCVVCVCVCMCVHEREREVQEGDGGTSLGTTAKQEYYATLVADLANSHLPGASVASTLPMPWQHKPVR